MIRYGIVGAGFIAHKFAEDIKASSNSVLVAVASRSLEKAEAFKEQHQISHAFGSYEELAKSDLIDAIYIATPHNFHLPQGLLFMEHKKHVLIEKPITVNKNQLEKLITNAKKHGVLLMEAMWSRFLPISKYVKSVVHNQELGKIKSIDLEFGYSLIENYSTLGRLLNPNLAGGSVLDIGVYPISFMNYLKSSPIKSIDAQANLHETGVDKNTTITVVFEDGVVAHLKSAIDHDWNKPGVIEFEKGTITIPDFSRSNICYVNNEKVYLPMTADGFTHQIDAFSNTIKEGKLENEIMSHKDSLTVMEIMDTIRHIIGVQYPFE